MTAIQAILYKTCDIAQDALDDYLWEVEMGDPADPEYELQLRDNLRDAKRAARQHAELDAEVNG